MKYIQPSLWFFHNISFYGHFLSIVTQPLGLVQCNGRELRIHVFDYMQSSFDNKYLHTHAAKDHTTFKTFQK